MFYAFIIVLTTICYCDSEFSRIKRTAVGNKWPENIIPYVISDSYADSDREFIQKIIKVFESSIAVNNKKCLQFVQRKDETSFMSFQDSDKCASNIGYIRGINTIKLSKTGCIRKGIILHEIMHSIGFDHEQSRSDRNEHVNVFLKNVDFNLQSNFDVNPLSNKITNQDSPYDYYSILQYNSHTLSNDKNPTITSKFPSLLQTEKIDYKYEELSQIDMTEIQRFYGCQEAPILNINPISEKQIENLHDSYAQLVNEAIRLDFNLTLANVYYIRSLKTCGSDHYWPLDYPIVPNHHELYKTVCLKKKQKNYACKLTIECENGMECSKILLRNGVCRKPHSSPFKIIARIIESKFKQFGESFKKRFDNELLDIKRVIAGK